ncbi:hypothetical protein ACSNN7_19835 [Micromonospora sp. URMC 105]|uniref:hypothetical protein n=1 Tax=Micromonospora sp. URMC 105 TaxID=3423413 RepID=UPI003F1DD07C
MIHQPADSSTCAVRMATRQWRSVNGVLDNVVNVEAENGDPHGLIATGIQILREGWRQTSGWTPETTGAGNWPPDDQEVTVSLTGAQWSYVISCLDRWYDVERFGGASTSSELPLIRELVISQAQACLPGQL